jgi:hypothetical protein
MPRTKINYNNTLIYKLVCNDLNVTDTYVGHTTNFNERKGRHKSVCNNDNSPGYNYKVYQTIRSNGGWDNWKIVMIEYFPCNNEREASARERYQYEILNSNMNSKVPGRSQKQHYEDNKEAKLMYQKQHYEDNKEAILLQHKQYYEDNKEAILLQHKQHYEDNKEAILLQHYLCDCGRNIKLCNKSRHLKTKIHLKIINLIPENNIMLI